MSRRLRPLVPVVVVVALAAALGVGCAASTDRSGGATGTSTTAADVRSPDEAGAPGTALAGGRGRLEGFGEITVTVVGADGRTRTLCLLLADTPAQQERGLMYVEDPTLGGYDGMLFRYARDDTGAFWMRHTRLPLSIAWIRADGTLVSRTDMVPCPDRADSCPTYPPGGAYRYAVEVPAGRLDELGIAEGARMEVGAAACAPRS